jgi:hypothetical protein
MGATETRQGLVQTASLTGLHWVGIVAALVTAAIHLLLGVRLLPSGLGISFLFAGLGFLGAIALVLVDYRRRAVYWVGVPFTLVQIGLWYYLNFVAGPKSFPADVGALGAVDKLAQVVLLVVLVRLLR